MVLVSITFLSHWQVEQGQCQQSQKSAQPCKYLNFNGFQHLKTKPLRGPLLTKVTTPSTISEILANGGEWPPTIKRLWKPSSRSLLPAAVSDVNANEIEDGKLQNLLRQRRSAKDK